MTGNKSFCNGGLRDTYNSKTASAVLFLSKSEGGGMLPWILDVQLLKSAGKIHAVLYSSSVSQCFVPVLLADMTK